MIQWEIVAETMPERIGVPEVTLHVMMQFFGPMVITIHIYAVAAVDSGQLAAK